MPIDISFNPEGHIYTVNGEVYPSVTQVLAETCMGWMPSDETAMQLGTAFHEATAILDRGQTLDPDSVDERIIPDLRVYQQALEDLEWHPAMIEKPLASVRYRFAGTMDRAYNSNSGTIICDLKRGEPCAWHSLQAAAYHLAYCEMFGVTGRAERDVSRCTMYCGGDSVKIKWHEDMRDCAVFLSALQVYNWRAKHNLLKRGR